MSVRTVTAEELGHPLSGYEEAVARALRHLTPLAPRSVVLREARGLVLAERVVAAIDVPRFANSAMDGYAIVCADTAEASSDQPVVLSLAGSVPAGRVASKALLPGTATKVMTGAPIPPGADAVVPWENTLPRGDGIAVLVPVAPGANVRAAAEDVRVGDEIAVPGTVLSPVRLGVLASVGRPEVLVHPRPRVAVLSTGDEVVRPGRSLGSAQLYDSNSEWIAAMCEATGAVVSRIGLIGDDPRAILGWLRDAAEASDLIVTSGGVSVGEHDWIRDLLERRGALEMWRVAMKPGKPTAIGRIAGRPLFGLPGNPGAAFVAFHVFVARAMRILAGRDPEPRCFVATLAEDVPGSRSRTFFCRVRLDGRRAIPLPRQSSAVLSNLVDADGFAIVPPGGLAGGESARVELVEGRERCPLDGG